MALKYKMMFSEENQARLAKMVRGRVDEARDSDMERAKALRIRKTNDMMFMRPTTDEYSGIYGYVAPLFWATVRNDASYTKVAFNNKPFVTIVPTNSTNYDNVEHIQKMVTWNILDTAHKEVFNDGIDDISQHGTAALKRMFMTMPRLVPETITDPITRQSMQKLRRLPIGNDYTKKVHIMNYLQDTSVLGNSFFLDGCKWVCELTKLDTVELTRLIGSDGAIDKNIKEAIIKIKELKGNRKHPFGSAYTEPTDGYADIDFNFKGTFYDMYGLFPIKGNETADRYYRILYCEETKKIMIVRPIDDHPYNLLKGIKRNDSYLGRADAESVGSNQLMTTLVTNKGLENLVANLQRYFFYLQGMFNPEDIQYEPNGAWVPTRFDKRGYSQISQIVQEFQGRDINVDSMRVFLALLNDHRQLATSSSDVFSHGIKPSVGGGMTHGGYTATSANIIEQNRSTPMRDMYNQIATGHEQHWNKKVLSLQMQLPDYVIVQVTGEAPEMLRKFMLTGSYEAHIKSGLSSNKAFKYGVTRDFLNFLTTIVQQSAAIPSIPQQLQDMNFRQLVRDTMNMIEMPNTDKILPENMPPQIGTGAAQPPTVGEEAGVPAGGAPATA